MRPWSLEGWPQARRLSSIWLIFLLEAKHRINLLDECRQGQIVRGGCPDANVVVHSHHHYGMQCIPVGWDCAASLHAWMGCSFLFSSWEETALSLGRRKWRAWSSSFMSFVVNQPLQPSSKCIYKPDLTGERGVRFIASPHHPESGLRQRNVWRPVGKGG